MKIGIIGIGKMGEAVVRGLHRAHAKDFTLMGTTHTEASAADAAKRLKIPVSTDNVALAKGSDILLLCVKPHQAEKVLRTLAASLGPKHLVISICASITTEQLAHWSGGKASIIRAMPNTPCLIGEGMTVLCAGAGAKASHTEIGEKIFGTLGRTAVVDEALMDGVTGLSGCGPAYVYLMIEALSEAGVKVGLSREVSTLLA
ncbi:MAG: pyrroline-5-carboxylate reductase family protein, partial [Bdellovibrionota bacterium]